jgi:hypothetical protein
MVINELMACIKGIAEIAAMTDHFLIRFAPSNAPEHDYSIE